MMTESTAEALVRYGFPLFWIGLGVVQWMWPSAIFVAFSDDEVTPGARGFAVLWLVLGTTLGYLFVPWRLPFSGWVVPGFVLMLVGALQFLRPAWTVSVGVLSAKTVALLCAAGGLAMLAVGLL